MTKCTRTHHAQNTSCVSGDEYFSDQMSPVQLEYILNPEDLSLVPVFSLRPAGGQSTWTATACDVFSSYLTGASAVMTIKVSNLFKSTPSHSQMFLCCIFCYCDLPSVPLPVSSSLLLQEEVKDLCPVPVTLSYCNEMGQMVSMADLLVSKGLALRERKPRSFLHKHATFMENQVLYWLQVQLAEPAIDSTFACLPNFSFICRDAADVKAKEVSSRTPVMEAQADETRNFGSAVAKLPLPSQISVPSARARPKLAPCTIMTEKVKHHLG